MTLCLNHGVGLIIDFDSMRIVIENRDGISTTIMNLQLNHFLMTIGLTRGIQHVTKRDVGFDLR